MVPGSSVTGARRHRAPSRRSRKAGGLRGLRLSGIGGHHVSERRGGVGPGEGPRAGRCPAAGGTTRGRQARQRLSAPSVPSSPGQRAGRDAPVLSRWQPDAGTWSALHAGNRGRIASCPPSRAIGQCRRRVSTGAVLAAARRQAGLTITQVSRRTRIRETIIRGIERDDFSACGADFYARGHIRAIARAAGVGRRAAGRGVRLHPGHAVGQCRCWSVRAVRLPPARGAAGRTGASRCWSCSRRSPAWSPITSWPLGPLAAAWLPPASRSPRLRPPASTRPPEHSTACRASRLTRRGDLPDGTERTLLGRPHKIEGRDNLPGHHRPGYLEDLDGTAGRHPEARAVTLTVDGKTRTRLGSQPVTLSLAPGKRTSG